MKYLIILIVGLLVVVPALAQPQPELPDYVSPTPTPSPTATPVPVQDNETESVENFVNGLPIDQWVFQLNELEQNLNNSQDFERPSVSQYVGDSFGFVWWVNNNRDALLGVFSPLFYNILIFAGWVIGSLLIYISVTIANSIRRMIQDFISATTRIISIILDFIPF